MTVKFLCATLWYMSIGRGRVPSAGGRPRVWEDKVSCMGNRGLHSRGGACPAAGRYELMVGCNGKLQPRTACWCPALYRGWAVRPEPYAALCQVAWRLRQGRTAECGIPHRCGPVELLCRCVPVTRIAQSKQARLGVILGAPRHRELIRAAPGNFTRWASSAAARGGRCVQQG